MADHWDMLAEELAEAPVLPTVIEGFGKIVDTFLSKLKPDDRAHYMFGLAWGDHPDPKSKQKGLRYTTILMIPVGEKSAKADRPGIAWLFGMAKRPDGSTAPFANSTIVHEDPCPAGHGGRVWTCNCVSEVVLDEIAENA